MKGRMSLADILRGVGILILLLGIYSQLSNMTKVMSYERAGAEIIRIEDGSEKQDSYGYTGYKSRKVYYARYTVNGIEYENKVYPPYGGGYEGMEVTVKYDPRDPSKIIYDEDGMSVSQGAPLAVGVILLTIGTYMSVNRKRKFITNI